MGDVKEERVGRCEGGGEGGEMRRRRRGEGGVREEGRVGRCEGGEAGENCKSYQGIFWHLVQPQPPFLKNSFK